MILEIWPQQIAYPVRPWPQLAAAAKISGAAMAAAAAAGATGLSDGHNSYIRGKRYYT